MQRFTELKVWQRPRALVLEVHRISAGFPAEERFLSRDLGYDLSPSAFDRLSADLDEIARMLHGLRSKVDET